MSRRFLLAPAVLLGFVVSLAVPADKADASKDALKALNEFVGQWKGNGESKSGKTELWKESAEWSWDLKGAEPALKVKFDGAKQYSEGRLTYLVDKKKYQFVAKDADKKDQTFTGEIKAKRLVLTRDDADSKDKYTIEMSTNNDGARFVYNVARQKGGKGIATKLAQVDLTKEGASLAGGKKAECIVTGGLGTMAVSYGGKTYYVCCSGCRDEFNANPKKYVDEYEKSKK
jgi:ribosomal protein L24E